MSKKYVPYNMRLDITEPEPILMLSLAPKLPEEIKSFVVFKSKCSDLTFKIDTDAVDVFTETYTNSVNYQMRITELNDPKYFETVLIHSGNITFKITASTFKRLKPYLQDLNFKTCTGDLELVCCSGTLTSQELEKETAEDESDRVEFKVNDKCVYKQRVFSIVSLCGDMAKLEGNDRTAYSLVKDLKPLSLKIGDCVSYELPNVLTCDDFWTDIEDIYNSHQEVFYKVNDTWIPAVYVIGVK